MDEVKFEEIPSYGDLFTIEDFRGYCLDGVIMDDDGSGNYATHDQMSNVDAQPSLIEKGEIDLRFTHVVWFNK